MKIKHPGLLKVALLQFCAGQDKMTNLAKAIAMSQEAIKAKAEFILLPEVFNFRGDAGTKPLFVQAREAIPGPSSDAFIQLAKKYKVSFLLGSILEKGKGRSAYNTSVYIDPRGRIGATYRKIHLFDAHIGERVIREADSFRAGKVPVSVTIGGFRTGLSICYDLRFGGLYQAYARQGVEILTVPSCFTRTTGEAHWEILLRARAIDNLAYVLAPAQVGIDNRGIQAHGNSMIVSPWGQVLARASGDAQEIIFAQIDLQEVKKARQALPGVIP